MAADLPVSTQTPPPAESKTARKKKAKAEAVAAAEMERKGSSSSLDPQQIKANGEEASYESPYIKELHNKIRNVNKRINALSKTEDVVKANPGVALDELVASRKLNADQKAAIEKKPFLVNQLSQLEEQISAYKKFDQEYQAQISKEKDLMHGKHKQELDEMKAAVEKETEIRMQKVWKSKMLTFSRFLSAVARRRQEDDTNEEGKAFEAILQYVYSGDPSAVTAAEKLIDGVEEQVPNVEGGSFNVTYARIKALALQETPQESEDPFPDDASTAIPQSDPTLANAGLTEVDTTVANGTSFGDDAIDSPAPASASVGLEAGNAAAESSWDAKVPGSSDVVDPLAESYEIVPRDPAETETPHSATVPVNSSSSWADEATATAESSWADDAQAAAGAESKAAPGNASTGFGAENGAAGDGFQAVHHGGRARGGRGYREFRGSRGRGDGRGRGFGRGDGRGRGRASREFRGRGRGDSSQ